ncbi:MAG: methylmalonyl-CoA epimerase [Dehalococcoidales bacterium]|nr:methylmalonyl-CoA epimerase [Dehalococcoidales bacterium]
MIKKVGHIGIAVNNLEKAKKLWRDAFGLEVSETKTDDAQKVNNAWVTVGNITIQLMETTDPEGPLGKFIQRRGEGVHHLHLEVTDMEETFKTLNDNGVTLVDKKPVIEPSGRKHLILHPRGTSNVLIQLSDD